MSGLYWYHMEQLSLWEDRASKLAKDGGGEYVLDFEFKDRTYLTVRELEEIIPVLEEWVRAAKRYMEID
ncbi:MAG: hypothetical protein KGY69_13250 [Bacteroidales bacterium]|nr:hypothetical protein [Bacteroidales bacterium]